MKLHYLEIVSADVTATCAAMAASGLAFGDEQAELGNARTAPYGTDALVGVRAPMHDAEETVTRPYCLVEDIEMAVAAAADAGAEIALPPMEIPGRGTCAICMIGGVQQGYWQL